MGFRHLVAIVVSFGVLLPPATASQAEAGTARGAAETEFVSLINELRSARGLDRLSVDEELVTEARRWADVMARDQQLRHAPDLSLGMSAGWIVLGENVGVHSAVDPHRLFEAFVESPSHLANLIDPRFDRVGVGVALDAGGAIWTTHRFLSSGRDVVAGFELSESRRRSAALPPPAGRAGEWPA